MLYIATANRAYMNIPEEVEVLDLKKDQLTKPLVPVCDTGDLEHTIDTYLDQLVSDTDARALLNRVRKDVLAGKNVFIKVSSGITASRACRLALASLMTGSGVPKDKIVQEKACYGVIGDVYPNYQAKRHQVRR